MYQIHKNHYVTYLYYNIVNSQKKYNFNCKDFYSSKNNVPF